MYIFLVGLDEMNNNYCVRDHVLLVNSGLSWWGSQDISLTTPPAMSTLVRNVHTNPSVAAIL